MPLLLVAYVKKDVADTDTTVVVVLEYPLWGGGDRYTIRDGIPGSI